MPCLKGPTITVPKLPAPLSFGVSIPGLSFDLNLCCKLPPISRPIPPIPLPPIVLNPAVIAILNAQIAIVVAFINSLSVVCPLE